MIDQHILDFNENLIGLRDFVELIDPFLTEKIEEHDQHIRPLVLSAMVSKILNESSHLEGVEKKEMLKRQKLLKDDLEKKYEEIPEVLIENNDEGEKKSLSIKIMGTNKKVSHHMETVHKTNEHIKLLYTNSLISALSSVEWFFSQLLHFYYDQHPESAGVEKRNLTLSDLRAFDSIQDAEKYLIDTKIDEILRGNFESWIELLKTEIKLGLGYLDNMINELTEIYQRRNLFVHNGGVVNSIYLAKVNERNRKDITNGQKLIVDKEYLDDSISKLQKAFMLIGAELWKKLNPANKNRGEILGNIVYENLLGNRWEICEGLSYFTIRDNLMNPVDKVIAQINYWLCKKELGHFKEIETELAKVDFSDKKEIFQLGLYALRSEHEKIIDLLPLVLDTNQTNTERLEEFPILRELRETDVYKKFKSESKHFKEESKEVKTPITPEKD